MEQNTEKKEYKNKKNDNNQVEGMESATNIDSDNNEHNDNPSEYYGSDTFNNKGKTDNHSRIDYDEDYDNLEDNDNLDLDDEDMFDDLYASDLLSGLNSFNLAIDDRYASVDKQEYIKLDNEACSSRKFTSVLAQSDDVIDGTFAVSYYRIFESVLKNTIHNNAIRIGAVLKNRSFMRNLVYEILDKIPSHVGRKSQGYLRKNMAISRKFIHDTINELIKSKLNQASNDMINFREGLASLIEIAILAQLLNFDLIDNSELSDKSLIHINNMICDDININIVKNAMLANEINRIIVNVIGSTSRLSNQSEGDNKSVDNEILVSNVIDELNNIADSLILFESSDDDIKDTFLLCRIYRDRILLSNIPEFSQLINECTLIYEQNRNAFSIILENYDFDRFIDEYDLADILNFKENNQGLLHIKVNRLIRITELIKNAFSREDSIIKIMDLEKFSSFFLFRQYTNEYGVPYVTSIVRRFEGARGFKIHEALGFKESISRDLAKFKIPLRQNIKLLINNKHLYRNETENLINDSVAAYVKAFEASYDKICRDMMFKAGNISIHQYSMLFKKDMNRLANLLCDEVMVPYFSYCEDILNLIEQNMDSRYNMNNYSSDMVRKGMNRIYICDTFTRYNRDVITLRDGRTRLATSLVPRVLECTNLTSLSGNSYNSIRIDSGFIPEGVVNVSERYSEADMIKDLTIFPTNRGLRIKIIEAQKIGASDDLFMNIDLDNLLRPVSNINRMVAVNNKYFKFLNAYCKSLLFFNLCNVNSTSGLVIEDELISQNTISDATIRLINRVNEGFNSTEALSFLWPNTIDNVDALFHIPSIRYSCVQFSRGIAFPFGSHEAFEQVYYQFATNVRGGNLFSNEEILEHIKNINLNKNFNLIYSNVAFFFNSTLLHIYNTNSFLSSIVDQCLNNNSKLNEYNTDDVQSIIELFERVNNKYVPKYIKLRTACTLVFLLLSMIEHGGDLDIGTNRTRKCKNMTNLFLSGNPIGMMYNHNTFDNFTYISDYNFISKMQILEELDISKVESLFSIAQNYDSKLFTLFKKMDGNSIIEQKAYHRSNKEFSKKERGETNNSKNNNIN